VINLWTIIISLAIGIIIGLLGVIPKKYIKYNSRFQHVGVVLLLFSMGASIGSNKKLISDLQNLGLKSITFAVLTTLFSVIVTFFTSSRYLKGDSSK
jgi:Kef-type K+ transport system membrane component KefB